MAIKTGIEWCDSSWNPVTGCLHDCEYCYAKKIARRFMGYAPRFGADFTYKGKCVTLENPLYISTKAGKKVKAPYPNEFDPTFHRYRLDTPQKWKKPRTIFVCSMADLFGEWVPDEWIQEVFKACAAAPQHRYLFLTKNPKRYETLAYDGKLPKQHWYGETYVYDKADHFHAPHYNTFLSVEPMLSPIHFYVGDLKAKWVIIGSETKNGKPVNPPKRMWIGALARFCNIYDVPLFMKDSLIPIVGEENMLREFPWEVNP
jgi:protein gp37